MERAQLARILGAPASSEKARTLIAEGDPGRFMAAFAAAVAGRGEVFLCNPSWGEAERTQVTSLLALSPGGQEVDAERGWLMIPTGGTSGQVRFARHDQNTVAAAVEGYRKHFGFGQVNALGLLPLHHVSGFMAWMRCVLSGGKYRPWGWKSLEAGDWPELPDMPDGWVASLVPTQLERLLRDDDTIARLRHFRCIHLGGAPAWDSLLDEAQEVGLNLSPGYGMTETAAMATALRPGEFLAGQRNSGTALPHVKLRLWADGRIELEGDSISRGYFPGWEATGEFATEDTGAVDGSGQLTVLGRRDGVIITGGEKVQPEEVEAVLRGSGQFADVKVLGIADSEWGERVVAAYAPGPVPDWAAVRTLLGRSLAGYKHPKTYLPITPWPCNAQGKVNRLELTEAVLARLHTREEDPSR